MRVFGREDAAETALQLAGVDVVLNCAGPFAATAEPLMKACIDQGIHYLDITAEINVYRLSHWEKERRGPGRGANRLPGRSPCAACTRCC